MSFLVSIQVQLTFLEAINFNLEKACLSYKKDVGDEKRLDKENNAKFIIFAGSKYVPKSCF